MELSARLAMSARVPARLIDMPEGCLPTATVSMRVGGLVVRSMTYSLLSGAGFQLPPSGDPVHRVRNQRDLAVRA